MEGALLALKVQKWKINIRNQGKTTNNPQSRRKPEEKVASRPPLQGRFDSSAGEERSGVDQHEQSLYWTDQKIGRNREGIDGLQLKQKDAKICSI